MLLVIPTPTWLKVQGLGLGAYASFIKKLLRILILGLRHKKVYEKGVISA